MTKSQIHISPVAKDAMDRAIGHALGRWQYVETALFALAHCLMGTPYNTSSIVFFHIRSAESKFRLTDKLVCEKLGDAGCKPLWKPIRDSFDEIARFRNLLAHFEVTWLDVNFARGETQYPIVLSCHHLDVVGNSKPKNGVYVEGILEGAEIFTNYARQILEFTVRTFPDVEQRVTQLPQAIRLVLATFRDRMPNSTLLDRPLRSSQG